MADRKESAFTQTSSLPSDPSDIFVRLLDNNQALASNKNQIMPLSLFDSRYFEVGNVTVFSSNAAETLSSSGIYIVASTTEDINLMTSPSSGQYVWIKNRSGNDLSVNYNGGSQIYTWELKNSITIIPGGSTKLIYDGTYWNEM